LNSRPVDYYREGGTTPHLRLVLFEEPSSWLAFKCYEYTVAKQRWANKKHIGQTTKEWSHQPLNLVLTTLKSVANGNGNQSWIM